MKLESFNEKLEQFNIYELIGVYLGDGSIIFKPPIHQFEICGNADDEQYYFSKISGFLKKEFDLNPRIRVKPEKGGQSLRLTVNNKNFVLYLRNELKLKFENKTFEGHIPKEFLDWEKSKHIIRGIFETDGSLYFSKSKKNKYPTYPRIEILTSSGKLTEQLMGILKEKGFLVQRRPHGSKTTRIYLSGDNMLEKWIKEIGFSKIKTITKHQIYKELGYYLPRCSLKERMSILRERC